MIEKLAEFLEYKKAFIGRLKNESRNGLSDNFLSFLINYHDSTERYISELELENLRLLTENIKLRKEKKQNGEVALESLAWLQSMLIKKFNNEL